MAESSRREELVTRTLSPTMNSQDLKVDQATAIKVAFPKERIETLKTILKLTELPQAPPINTTPPWKLGIDVPWLSKLKATFESDAWQADTLLEKINAWPNYIVRMKASDDSDETEFVDIHFMHIKSNRSDAIPLLMVHGWPGTFWDFHKVIEPLTNPPAGFPAFDLVLPSLPGYFLSTLPQRYHFTIVHIAALFNRLMTKVLNYPKYCAQGGDWGCYIVRVIGALYADEAPLVHLNMFGGGAIPKGGITSKFTEAEEKAMQRGKVFLETGRGYIEIQSTKPFTIGIAIASSPVALLTYIGEKMYMWSDPSKLDLADVIDNVALYYLSGCFATSVMIYHQTLAVRSEMRALHEGEPQWKIKSKIGYTLFPFEIGASPRAYIEPVGPLVFYKERSSGGHFAALDNPEGLVEDLREFLGDHWGK